MKKKTSYFLQVVIIISLEFVSLACFKGGHNIIPIALLSRSGNIILELISNLVYFLIYFFLYVFIIGLTTEMYYDKNKALKSIGALLVLRIIFDIIGILIGNIFVTIAYALNYIIESVFIILMYLLLIRYYSNISFKCLIESKKNLICSISALFLIFVLNILYFFMSLNEYSKITNYLNKYNATGEQIKSLCNKGDFICDVYGVGVITAVSIVMFALTARISRNLPKVHKKSRYNMFFRAFAILCISLMAVCFFCFFKNIISPAYSISDINISSSISTYSSESNEFANDYQETIIKAVDGFGNEADIYTQKTYYIMYGDKQLLKIKPVASPDIINTISGDRLTINDGTYEIEVEGIEAKRLLNHAIMYKSDTNAVAVSTEDIPYLEKDENIIAILKKLISDGYFDYFEYGCEYLLKYDPEFITPYINRYANGDFTENELSVNEEIKTEYMVSVANKYL